VPELKQLKRRRKEKSVKWVTNLLQIPPEFLAPFPSQIPEREPVLLASAKGRAKILPKRSLLAPTRKLAELHILSHQTLSPFKNPRETSKERSVHCLRAFPTKKLLLPPHQPTNVPELLAHTPSVPEQT